MKISKKVTGAFLCTALSLLVLFLVRAELISVNMKIPVLANSCGGAVSAFAGNLSVPFASIGRSVSGIEMSALNYKISGGLISVVIAMETAKKDLNAAFCYPVPFKPSKGHANITFKNLTRDAEILIYTVAGELARKLVKSDAKDYLEWNATNSSGEKLASGVYLYVIKTPGSIKKGKLIIIR